MKKGLKKVDQKAKEGAFSEAYKTCLACGWSGKVRISPGGAWNCPECGSKWYTTSHLDLKKLRRKVYINRRQNK